MPKLPVVSGKEAREALEYAREQDMEVVYLDEYMLTTRQFSMRDYHVKKQNIEVD